MRSIRNTVGICGIVALAFTGLTACDSGANSSSDPGGQQCFSQLNSQQTAQMAQYASSNGQNVQAGPNDTVCVVDANGNQRFLHQQDGDNFMYYLMMSHMLGGGSSNGLMTYGLISGSISPTEYLALSMLTGVSSSGQVYHPYTRQSNGSWVRQPTYTTTKVKNVYYGNTTKPVSFTKASKTMPKSYAAMAVPKATSNGAAVVNKSGSFKVDTTKKAPSYKSHSGGSIFKSRSKSGGGFKSGGFSGSRRR